MSKDMNHYFIDQATQALQFLDELGGPSTVDDYVACMMAISRHCLECADRAIENRSKLESAGGMRPATLTERTVWTELWNKHCGHDIEFIEEGKAYVKLDYCSDTPGYQGPVGLVFWGEPQYVSIFCWDRKKNVWYLEQNYGS